MRIVVILMLVVVGVAVIAAPVVRADDSNVISDDQVAAIRQNCKQAQSTLQRLQSTDVATRVSRGQIYETLLSKLIGPLNTRVNANGYDASGLTDITGTLTKKFTDFKNDYSSYATSYANLLTFNCEANPRGFYTLLVMTREKRTDVATDIADLDSDLAQYETGFMTLRASIEGSR